MYTAHTPLDEEPVFVDANENVPISDRVSKRFKFDGRMRTALLHVPTSNSAANFATQPDAQRYFERHQSADPHGLDKD